MYANLASCSLHYSLPQEQGFTTDCGLFAIANAYNILCGRNPLKIQLDQGLMRQHLRNCLQSLVITDFPYQPKPLTWYESYMKDQHMKTMEQKARSMQCSGCESLCISESEERSNKCSQQTCMKNCMKITDKERMAKKRLLQTVEQTASERAKNKERIASIRLKLTDNQKEVVNEKNRRRMFKTRAESNTNHARSKNREAMQQKRAQYDKQQKNSEQAQNREATRQKRAHYDERQKNSERAQNRQAMQKKRALYDEQQKNSEHAQNREATQQKRIRYDEQQKNSERAQNREATQQKRIRYDEQQKNSERAQNREAMQKKRALYDEQQKNSERAQNREATQQKRIRYDEQQKNSERAQNRDAMQKKRARYDEQQKNSEHAQNRDAMQKKRARYDEQQKNMERTQKREDMQKIRAGYDEQQKNMKRTQNTGAMQKERARYDEQQKNIESHKNIQRKQLKRHPCDIELNLELFKKAITDYAKYICTCCNRLLYRQGVTRVTNNLKAHLPENLKRICISNCKSALGMEWICITCKSYILRNKLPPQSNANNLSVPLVPKQLKDLTSLEVRLLCQRYPFMKLLALPRGKQSGLKGTVVNIPIDHKAVCNSLPATPRQAGIIPLKLKRRIQYKGYEMFQFIRPNKVKEALHWLQKNNELYQTKDVYENKDWEQSCKQEDATLWTELTMDDSADIPSTRQSTHSHNSSEQTNRDSQVDCYDDDPLCRLRGVKYDTCIQPVHPELDVDKVVNLAPGENQHPINILMDEKFEEMAFPHLLPYGKFGWKHNRKVPLTAKKYFQKRLLDASGQFAQDIEYLFVAQTITETKQIMDSMNIAVRKCYRGSETDSTVNAGLIRDETSLQRYIFKDQAYRFLQPVRGSPPYWQKIQYKLFSAIKQFGIFTWFFTLSAADLKWYDTIQEIKAQSGVTITMEQIDALSWEDKCRILRSNPVTAARHFQYRLDNFLKHVILSKSEPVGPVLHYFYRIEFQQRGSPHAHGVLWIKGAPDPESDSEELITSFVDRYITCEIPSKAKSPKLYSLVTQLQKHSHSGSCKKSGKTCRFNFPKPISSATVLTPKESSDIPPELHAKRKEAAVDIITVVKAFIQTTEGVEDMSYRNVIDSCKLTKTQYQDALKTSSKPLAIHLKRYPSAININNYNKWLLLGWEANMDIQFVSNPYACIQYIVSYVTKDEREMGTLLQAVQKESADSGIKQQMKRCGQAFLNARSVTAQEAAYRVLGLPLHKSNFQTVWIPTGLPTERVGLLKPSTVLTNMEDDDEDIFIPGILDKYSCRPQQLDNWFLALFASWYKSGSEIKEDKNDFQPDILQEDHTVEQAQEFDLYQEIENSPSAIRISMLTATVQMKKRKRQAVIRYHKFSEYRQPESFYHSQLLLFLPWRQEDLDLLQDFETYLDCYNANKDIIEQNKSYIHKHEQLINEALENTDDHPENAWDTIAAQTQQEQCDCEDQGAEVDPDHQILLPEENTAQDNTQLPEPRGNTSIAMAIDTQPTILPFDDYCKHIRSLNKEQYEVIQIVLNWCTTYRQTKSKPDPLHLYVSGGAGTGKSYLIKAIYHTIRMSLNREGEHPDLTKVLLLAPTGTAAYNIEGLTIHSAFLFTLGSSSSKSKNKKQMTYQPLSDEKRNTLRAKLSNLAFIIIDEISMVSSDLLLRIHNRLQELFGGSTLFGGISIITFGDMYQIPPVAQKFIFQQPTDNYAALAPSLWTENFKYLELTQIMRQQKDKPFAEMLNRIRKGEHTSKDIDLLKTRSVDDDISIPSNTLHVFPFNAEVNVYNSSMLHQLPDPPVVLTAVDKKPASMKDYTPSDDERFTGGLPSFLNLAIGARVMVIRNIDVSDGLVNGSQGCVQNFIFSSNRLPIAVIVKFDNPSVGRNARLQSALNLSAYDPTAVPILQMEVSFSPTGGKVTITRKQFPLKLCWASSIHKVQGATVDRIAVSFEKTLRAGQAYVALSRSKTLDGIYIRGFDEKRIKVDPNVTSEMKRLTTDVAFNKPFEILKLTNCVSIAFLNARSARLHFPDIMSHPILQHADILCFTESHITDTDTALYQMDNRTSYHLPYNPALNCHGLSVYVKSTINVSRHFAVSVPHMEALTFETKRQTFQKKITLVYRSPSSRPQTFFNKIRQLVSQEETDLVIGDFNMDVATAAYTQLSGTLSQYRQLVTKPTHNTGSTLDLAFIRQCETCENEPLVNIYPTYFSDHSIVNITFKMA
jgi:hypothetical protein